MKLHPVRGIRISRRKIASLAPVKSAEVAHLRYLSDVEPGISRVSHGEGFRYLDARGKAVRDPATLARIRALVLPPAWRHVWICSSPNGHLQATGIDARGRKQYRYHERWRAVRDEVKFGRVIEFAKALSMIRPKVDLDLALPGLPREKVIATIVRLLETTLIRVGNEEYARINGSFGLTTLRNRHVTIAGSKLHFHFRGKGGVVHAIDITDRRLARIVQRCHDLPGQELFLYESATGVLGKIDSADVNNYLQTITGQPFTAKDFRTWFGTVLAVGFLLESQDSQPKALAKKNVVSAIGEVAKRLGNTRAVCRKCYIHPGVVDAYLDQSLHEFFRRSRSPNDGDSLLSTEEAKVLRFLQWRLAKQSEPIGAN